jgi:MoaA/NifB/PqqE/SkfB family radical SAM enzyme
MASTDRIVALTDELHIPISVHLAMPDPFKLRQRPYGGWFRFPDDVEVVERITETLIAKEKRGGLFTEPGQYFKEMAMFFKGQRHWPCESGLHSIAVDVDGRIMQCVSSPFAENLFLLRASDKDLYQVKEVFRQRLSICNPQCLSCASFDIAYFRKRPWQFLRKMYYWYKNGTRKRNNDIQNINVPAGIQNPRTRKVKQAMNREEVGAVL